MLNYINEIKYFFKNNRLLNKKESSDVLLIVLFISIMFGFNDGRNTTSVDLYWGIHLVFAFIGTYLAIIVSILSTKIYSYLKGFNTILRINYYGVLGGLILTLLLRGIPVFTWGGIELSIDEKRRFGRFKRFMLTSEMATASIVGVTSNLIVGTILVIIASIIYNNPLIRFLGVINLLFAVYSLIPLPPYTNAFPIMFNSIGKYVFFLSFVIVYSILILNTTFIIALLIGLITSGVMGYWYVKKYE